MDISVNSSAEELELNLGTCRAKLDTTQAKLLRNQLAEVLLNALYEQPDYWQNLTTKLEELKYLTAILFSLDDEQLLQVIQACHQPHWLALVRFAQKEQPKLVKRLLKAIGKIDSPIFTSLDEFTDLLNIEPASSIAEVVTALNTLNPIIQQYCPEILESKNQINQTANSSSFDVRAVTFLTNLSDLPTSNLRLVLKSLSGRELGWLFSSCKMLQITSFLEQLKNILPEKLFLQLESKCPTTIEEINLRSLINKLNQQLKELKTLLKNRSQQ